MRILLTNIRLEQRAGSELYAADVAGWLRDNGHTPIVYSTRLGPMAETIRAQAIPVISDLAQLADPPDVIHGQHHLAAMTALASFPLTPAVYFCHGWLPWDESPPRHPAIRRYVAVSGATRERLVSESGVSPESVRLLPNFVDLRRFQPRTVLPPRPRRALIFSNHTARTAWVDKVRAACSLRDIHLDLAGLGSGHELDDPGTHLLSYDLVFARGRSALEAMAVGAAVILCDVEGLGPMVTAGTLDQLRLGNFGMQVMREAHGAEGLLQEIDRYDPVDAARVSQKVREVHALSRVAPAIAEIYEEALRDARTRPHGEDEARRAEVEYLRWLNRTFPLPMLEQRRTLGRRLLETDMLLRTVTAERGEARSDADGLRAAIVQQQARADRLSHDAERLRAELTEIRAGLLFRRLLPPLWGARRRILPDGSQRLAAYRRARSTVGGRSRRQQVDTLGADPAETATDVPPEAILSAVVLDVGAQRGLSEAVRSLADQRPAPEMIVVSSGGGDAEDLLRGAGLAATVVRTSSRLLPGAARNVGIAASTGHYVAFLAGDCIAEPGWVAGRLAAHAAGAGAVSSAVTNADPWNPFAAAAHALLFARRLPGTPRDRRLDYGASYDRALFDRYGRFRTDLRTGEDSEFNARCAPQVGFIFRQDVRSAHHNPTSLQALLSDQFQRGQRMVRARDEIHGGRASRPLVAMDAIRRVRRSMVTSLRATPIRSWGPVLVGAPWMIPGSLAYALGAAGRAKRESPTVTGPSTALDQEAIGARDRPPLLCVLAFHDERVFLPGFLDNVAPHVDGILALDDGSTDGSGEIVAGHPAVAEVLRVGRREPHVWDELRNRRLLIDAAERHGADWVLALDADERLERDFRLRANSEIQRAQREGHLAYKLSFRELWDRPDQYRVDGIWGTKRSARLFRVRGDHDFGTMALHGHWAPLNSKGANGDFPAADLIFYHLRMIDPADRERRKRRYQELDPERRWQSVGYEYLTDESGLRLEDLPPGRDYVPLAMAARTT